jgi:hypothetical protein
MAEQQTGTTTWPELGMSLYEALTGKGAEITYEFENLGSVCSQRRFCFGGARQMDPERHHEDPYPGNQVSEVLPCITSGDLRGPGPLLQRRGLKGPY